MITKHLFLAKINVKYNFILNFVICSLCFLCDDNFRRSIEANIDQDSWISWNVYNAWQEYIRNLPFITNTCFNRYVYLSLVLLYFLFFNPIWKLFFYLFQCCFSFLKYGSPNQIPHIFKITWTKRSYVLLPSLGGPLFSIFIKYLWNVINFCSFPL